jgi:cupin fold WbuC family metalloprotein
MSTNPSSLEWIKDDAGTQLALIVWNDYIPSTTQFVTPDDFKQQVGFIVYAKEEAVKTHRHLPLHRHLIGTSEAIIVRQGRALFRLYDLSRTLIANRELKAGDIILMINGWHGVDFLEDTILLEIKQGPFLDMKEKEFMESERVS